MQVLEMEDMEALVGNSNRKRLGASSRKQNSSKFDILLSFFQQGDILPKLVVTACVILLGLLYLSAQDDPVPIIEGKDHGSSNNVALTRTASPTSATLPPTEPDTTAATEKTVEDNGENNAFKYSKYATIVPLVNHALPSEEVKEEYAEKYGKWHFWDGEEDERPMEDYTSKYPNRDIPGEDFPDLAWQADAVYVNHLLNDADQLISRTMEAIFEEYGHGKPLPPEGLAARMRMFHWSREDLSRDDVQAPDKDRRKGNGGWTTKRSHDGLVRRLLHAIMTQDTFTVVLGGHSIAAGAGNHWRQSYLMQFHKVMYPVFARLGVKLITSNQAHGGMGTIQSGMGSGSLYGDEVDILMWDSGMTETQSERTDVFYRQALLAGNRVPVLWGGPFELLKMLHEEADVDVGDWGDAMDGIPEVESYEHAQTLPWAARYMKCKEEAEYVCKEEPKYCRKCWIDREDNIKPEKEQNEGSGQSRFHPGWRYHQLMGRNLAFALLDALQAAVNIWTEGVMGGPPLADEEWHVTEYYENIRNKVKNLDDKLGSCYNIAGELPTRLCNTPMKAKTQYTPRPNFHETALTSIIKPTSDGYVPRNEKKLLPYEGPDAHDTCFDVPEGEVDVFNVVTGRRALSGDGFGDLSLSNMPRTGDSIAVNTNRMLGGKIKPGSGWILKGEPQGLCDGSYNARCVRSARCLLSGHHGARGAVFGNENSGWLVMTLDDLKEGLIILKLFTGGPPDYDPPELPDELVFEYAIDGKITSLAKDAFLEQKHRIQKYVEILTILDDPNFTSESKDVEFAIRLRGSGEDISFGVSHVYWA